jgi:hypothetical protein
VAVLANGSERRRADAPSKNEVRTALTWRPTLTHSPKQESNQGEDDSFPYCTADALFNRLFLLLRNAHGLDYTPWANTR